VGDHAYQVAGRCPGADQVQDEALDLPVQRGEVGNAAGLLYIAQHLLRGAGLQFENVGIGNNTGETTLGIDYADAVYPVPGHAVERLEQKILFLYHDQGGAHDRAGLQVGGVFARSNHLVAQIAVGENADGFPPVDNDDTGDVAIAHARRRLDQRSIRRAGHQVAPAKGLHR